MVNEIRDLQSLNFHELIGGPLIAMVKAEALAANTTLEYIEQVGFVDPGSEGASSNGDTIVGKLRMAKFSYRKLDENGNLGEFESAVPVLSLVPIPLIQIGSAKVAFSVKITDVITQTTKTSATLQNPSKSSWLKSEHTELRAVMGSRPTTDEKTERNYQMDIEVKIEKADVPAGLIKILNMMDQAINDKKTLTK
jgi:hypothetical protein